MKTSISPFLAFLPFTIALGELPEPRFEAVTIDDKIQIGYGVAVADVDGDKRPDILLADKKQFVWYRNPGPEKAAGAGAWQKFVIAENLTKNDNVCLAAQDIDGDGKCELAVGAEWNPGDTVNSGAVFYMIATADRTQPWTSVKLPAEPTTHRMRWIKLDGGKWGLVVVPLHGKGNKNGEGERVSVLLYDIPANVVENRGKRTLISDAQHMTHNFEIVRSAQRADELLIAGKEGVVRVAADSEKNRAVIVGKPDAPQPIVRPVPAPVWVEPGFMGAGEVRLGNPARDAAQFLATVEPMHGNQLVVYSGAPLAGTQRGPRRVLTDKLVEGHALGCGDLLGTGSDQIVVGWRGTPGKEGSTHGIHLWTALDPAGEKWRESAVDDGGMACEDLTLADLDGDGKLDIVASGRATKNVKVYFNRTAKAR